MRSAVKWKIGWGFTSRCNMACDFCYSGCHRSASRQNKGYAESAKRFVDRHADSIDSINYGTGENTMSPDWWSFVRHVGATYPHIRQGVTTNGYLSEQIRRNREYNTTFMKYISDVDVSVDYANSHQHNATRRHNHAYEWAMETLSACENIDIDVTIVMVATRRTFSLDNISKLVELARSFKAGLRVNILRPVAPKMFEDTVSLEQLYSGIMYLLKSMNVQSLSDPLIAALCGEQKYNGDFTGVESFRILDDGAITPSTYLLSKSWRAATIDEDFPLDQIRAKKAFSMIVKQPTPHQCMECEFLNWCRGGAVDRRWLWYGSLDYPDPYCPLHPCSQLSSDYVRGNPLLGVKFAKAPTRNLVHDGYLPTLIFE